MEKHDTWTHDCTVINYFRRVSKVPIENCLVTFVLSASISPGEAEGVM